VKSILAVGWEKVKLEGVKQYCRQPSLRAFNPLCFLSEGIIKFSSDVWLVNDCSPPARLGLD
jgi:hypothetical protein